MALRTEQELAQDSMASPSEEPDTVPEPLKVGNSYLWLAVMAPEHSQYWPGHFVRQLQEKLGWNE